MVTTTDSKTPSAVARRIRVLIVEDNPLIQTLLEEGLSGIARRRLREASYFEFVRAGDGRQALEKLVQERFDLAIVDLFLPVLDGTRLIQMIRRDPSAEMLPILVVSSGGDEAGQAALAAGANVFLPKPLRLEALFETIRQLLQI